MRIFLNVTIVFSLVFSAACGRTDLIPTGPGPVEPPPSPVEPPPPPIWTVSGRVINNLGSNQPIPGANVHGEGLNPTHTNETGSFSITSNDSSDANYKLVLSAGGFVERQTWLRGGSTRQTDDMGLIPTSSLAFYRQFARGGLEQPESLRPIFRKLNHPSFYVKTTDEKGNEIPKPTIDMIIDVIRRSIPELTGGRFQATIETGREERFQGSSGLVSVEITTDPGFTYCGLGASGLVRLKYGGSTSCSCGSSLGIASRTVAHEVGHSMGFDHTSEFEGVMNSKWSCSMASFRSFSEKEKSHADIVYSRPNGNADPDNDIPATNFAFSFSGEGGVESRCFPQ